MPANIGLALPYLFALLGKSQDGNAPRERLMTRKLVIQGPGILQPGHLCARYARRPDSTNSPPIPKFQTKHEGWEMILDEEKSTAHGIASDTSSDVDKTVALR